MIASFCTLCSSVLFLERYDVLESLDIDIDIGQLREVGIDAIMRLNLDHGKLAATWSAQFPKCSEYDPLVVNLIVAEETYQLHLPLGAIRSSAEG